MKLALLLQPADPGKLFPVNHFRSDWLFFLLLIPVILYTVISSLNTGEMKSWVRAILSSKYAATEYKNVSGNYFASALLGLATFISVTTFLYFSCIEFNLYPWKMHGAGLWFTNLGIVAAVYLARIVLSKITGEISGSRNLFNEYVFNINSFYKFAGLLLSIINFLVSYLDVIQQRTLIISGFIIFAMVFLLRFLRLINIFIRRKSSFFYMILYLCALEITPVLVLIKFISGTF